VLRAMGTLPACGTKKSRGAALLWRRAILIAVFLATNPVTSAQSNPSGRPLESETHRFRVFFTPMKSQTFDVPYHPLTSQQSLRWFTTTTMDPANLVGEIFQSALGTAPNRPQEYGPHWAGFADRYGINVTRSVTGNAIEAGASLILREDPRYFRMPERPFKARVGNVVRLAFAARGGSGGLGPAYGRYMTIFGDSFLSNTWRVHSEANAHDALLRTSEGFGGVLAGNAFEEFWPDIEKLIVHKHF